MVGWWGGGWWVVGGGVVGWWVVGLPTGLAMRTDSGSLLLEKSATTSKFYEPQTRKAHL